MGAEHEVLLQYDGRKAYAIWLRWVQKLTLDFVHAWGEDLEDLGDFAQGINTLLSFAPPSGPMGANEFWTQEEMDKFWAMDLSEME